MKTIQKKWVFKKQAKNIGLYKQTLITFLLINFQNLLANFYFFIIFFLIYPLFRLNFILENIFIFSIS